MNINLFYECSLTNFLRILELVVKMFYFRLFYFIFQFDIYPFLIDVLDFF